MRMRIQRTASKDVADKETTAAAAVEDKKGQIKRLQTHTHTKYKLCRKMQNISSCRSSRAEMAKQINSSHCKSFDSTAALVHLGNHHHSYHHHHHHYHPQRGYFLCPVKLCSIVSKGEERQSRESKRYGARDMIPQRQG